MLPGCHPQGFRSGSRIQIRIVRHIIWLLLLLLFRFYDFSPLHHSFYIVFLSARNLVKVKYIVNWLAEAGLLTQMTDRQLKKKVSSSSRHAGKLDNRKSDWKHCCRVSHRKVEFNLARSLWGFNTPSDESRRAECIPFVQLLHQGTENPTLSELFTKMDCKKS